MKESRKYPLVFPLTLALGLMVGGSASAEVPHLKQLEQAAKSARRDAAAQIAYGRALIEANRLGPAEAQMKRLVQLEKGSIESMYELARVKFAEDNHRKARGHCSTLLAKDKGHVLSHVCMARAFLVWRRASRAFEHIDRAIAIDPNNYEALLALGDARRMQGEREAAQAAYDKAIAAKPDAADAYLGLGRLRVLQAKPDQAREVLQKALERAPNDPQIQYELALVIQNKPAMELLAKALLTRPDWMQARAALAQARLDAGRVDEAVEDFREILADAPEQLAAAAGLARALMAQKNYAEAEPALTQALQLQPTDPELLMALAEVYRNTDRPEEAFNQYRAAASVARTDPTPFIRAAELALSINRSLLAAAFLEKALERAPNSGAALAMYARVLANRGDRAAARDYYHRALKGEGEVDRSAINASLQKLK